MNADLPVDQTLLALSSEQHRNVILLGSSNAGKSSLLNQILGGKQQVGLELKSWCTGHHSFACMHVEHGLGHCCYHARVDGLSV
jgi:predicted GTPase